MSLFPFPVCDPSWVSTRESLWGLLLLTRLPLNVQDAYHLGIPIHPLSQPKIAPRGKKSREGCLLMRASGALTGLLAGCRESCCPSSCATYATTKVSFDRVRRTRHLDGRPSVAQSSRRAHMTASVRSPLWQSHFVCRAQAKLRLWLDTHSARLGIAEPCSPLDLGLYLELYLLHRTAVPAARNPHRRRGNAP